MLTDAQVERYSRQIVLPEIGARGQERLLAARVAVAGETALVRMLLERAGVGRVDADPSAADVAVHVGDDGAPAAVPPTPAVVGGAFASGLVVATLVGRPCARCFAWRPANALAVDADPAARLALAALVAAEVVRVLVRAPERGRCTTVRWADASADAVEIGPTAGCESCGTAA
jgi:hypothetical protein